MPNINQGAISDSDWYALDPETAINRLNSNRHTGLTSDEVKHRQGCVGLNKLPSPTRHPWWKRILSQFHNVLIYVMLAGAIITLWLGHLIDAGVLMAAVLVNAAIGFIQEGKAEKSLDAIRHMLSLQSMVIRNGETMTVAADQLVPGDIVLLASGDKVPADLRLVGGKNTQVNEAILTGESNTVEKSIGPVPLGSLLGDRTSMLYSGTLIAAGQAVGLVVATGIQTELGRIGTLLEQVDEATTPLLGQINRFSRLLAIAIVTLSILTFMLGTLWRDHAPEDMFIMVVALAASAIPEGLPAIITITLAIGVRRMAARQAIVRHLPAVEALGSVTVICTDKTGTLTRNEMTVQRVVTADGVIEVSGVGYAPVGALHSSGIAMPVEDYPVLESLAEAAVLCNDATLNHHGGDWTIQGDPTEGALLTFAAKTGVDLDAVRVHWPRTDVIPFESEHRLMATLNHDHTGHGCIYVKGAPEQVSAMCNLQTDGRTLDRDYWQRAISDCAARGLRLLALASKPVAGLQRTVQFDDLKDDFTLLALIGIIDPPREEATAAVNESTAAGIRVKMITGDHADTARAIGAQMGIGRDQPALTGSEIELMDDEQLQRVVTSIDVFARASPEHKLRLVNALQAQGEVVAMTGDGVNDAPALKRANVGVAMGKKGTEAAKEAADMVLADDNFATISNAVREGRGIYDNIQKFVLFMLPTNGGEGLVVVAAILFELILPITPAQVLWINMVTSSTLGLALAFEPPESDVMNRRPRSPNTPLLSWFFVWRVLMVSFLMMGGALGLFLWELHRGASLETARTVAVCSIVVAEMFYLLCSRHIYQSSLSLESLSGNRYLLYAIVACGAFQLLYVYSTPLQAVFRSTSLSLDEWSRVLLAGLLLWTASEIEKKVLSMLNKQYI